MATILYLVLNFVHTMSYALLDFATHMLYYRLLRCYTLQSDWCHTNTSGGRGETYKQVCIMSQTHDNAENSPSRWPSS